MTDSGKVMTLAQPGLILLFAGDKPGSTAYGEYAVPLDPGSYEILEGHYKPAATEEVYVYRLQPKVVYNSLHATAAASGSNAGRALTVPGPAGGNRNIARLPASWRKRK